MNIKSANIFFTLLVLVSCVNINEQEISIDLVKNPLSAAENHDEVAMPIIELDHDLFDFIEINQNESVSTEFMLRNIGDAPLLIRSAKGSCGCTVTEWPKDPIASSEDAIIKVTFNSGNKKGMQNKTVTLVTNAIPSTKVLTITGNVLVSENN